MHGREKMARAIVMTCPRRRSGEGQAPAEEACMGPYAAPYPREVMIRAKADGCALGDAGRRPERPVSV